jgi:hypothetical protein
MGVWQDIDRSRGTRDRRPQEGTCPRQSLGELIRSRQERDADLRIGSGNPIMKNQSCDGVPGVVTQSRVRRLAKNVVRQGWSTVGGD